MPPSLLNRALLTLMLLTTAIRAAEPATQPAPFIAGADISMLPELEKAGAVYRNNSQPGDAVTLLHDHGVNLFRLRLFVAPTTDFNKSWGATQNLDQVRALAQRAKASGAKLLLDIHYSDTWADPAHQHKPAAWAALDFEQLKDKVHTYTAEVLKDLADNNASPDMVQVGNEIGAGLLWPEGKIPADSAPNAAAQWQRIGDLFNAGASAVRAASTPEHPIQVVLHIHNGGKPGMAKWFFSHLMANKVDFDIIALSFYPAWGDTLPALKDNLRDLEQYNKPVLLAETSYPWRDMPDLDAKYKPAMTWPMTQQGQSIFLRDLTAFLRALPNHQGLGYIWWYPEAIPTKGLGIWRNGAEALFDEQGNLLPSVAELSPQTQR
jgi:arabinogalactan endo-1,4-beta-galactosidase